MSIHENSTQNRWLANQWGMRGGEGNCLNLTGKTVNTWTENFHHTTEKRKKKPPSLKQRNLNSLIL